MLKVYFTVDVELWCEGWNDIDNEFKGAFNRCINGSTAKGDYGLGYQLNLLNEYGLKGVFFVEPLFSLRCGLTPLKEIVEQIIEASQAVELHLHTEWVDEVKTPIFPSILEKKQHIKYFSEEEQKKLIEIGKSLLSKCGVSKINAFRAGSFGFNIHTLAALYQNNILVDSSYNASLMGLDSGLMPGQILTEPVYHAGVYEVPMTVFYDRPNHLRHTQLCACSSRELEAVLWKALEEGRQDVVILSHSFELLDSSRTRVNPIVLKRFQKLCKFLDKNRDCFSVEDFSMFFCNISPQPSPIWNTGLRFVEQALSKI